MKLYLFNPDSDLALADNGDNYIPPLSVRRFAEDLALLPVWYAQPGSAVLAASAYNADYLKLMKQLFPIQVELVTQPELPALTNVQVVPWGWSFALRKRLKDAGFPENRLPSMDDVFIHRLRSSRLYSFPCAREVESILGGDGVCGGSAVVDANRLKQMEALMAEGGSNLKASFVFKSLWSGSGRGLMWCMNGITKSALDWCRREVAEHESVIMESVQDKVEDFAMEFYGDGEGRVVFTGYSSFATTSRGMYRSSALAPDALIEKLLCRYVPLSTIVRVRGAVQQVLEMRYDDYAGPIGVDMMVRRSYEKKEFLIHPFVEVNLRMTMGMVARRIYDQFVTPDRTGRFYIETYPSPQALEEKRSQNIREHPLLVKKGRIVSGCLELVPVTPRSRSRAYVLVE